MKPAPAQRLQHCVREAGTRHARAWSPAYYRLVLVTPLCLPFSWLIACLSFNRGVELLGSATAGLYLNIMPVTGAMLAVTILAEPFSWFHFLGMCLIGAGILAAKLGEA